MQRVDGSMRQPSPAPRAKIETARRRARVGPWFIEPMVESPRHDQTRIAGPRRAQRSARRDRRLRLAESHAVDPDAVGTE
jgi:hypothetical protein